ncbi:MAG: hypothetical protein QOH15_2188, partial [Gaiellales bacterium]|nr:hypothetical protein [Gaiellales bacterium]
MDRISRLLPGLALAGGVIGVGIL